MIATEYQTWPDGTLVKFNEDALKSMARKNGLRAPKGDRHGIFTIDNTRDSLHDVTFRETGERWGTGWLEPAFSDQPELVAHQDMVAKHRHQWKLEHDPAYRDRDTLRRLRELDWELLLSPADSVMVREILQ